LFAPDYSPEAFLRQIIRQIIHYITCQQQIRRTRTGQRRSKRKCHLEPTYSSTGSTTAAVLTLFGKQWHMQIVGLLHKVIAA
jgi:hypothetical protein